MDSRIAELVARLREAARIGKPTGHMMLATSELKEAADALERLSWRVYSLEREVNPRRNQ